MSSRPDGGAVYIDSSVLVALLSAGEPEHSQARRWAGREARAMVSSVLIEVEVARALRRRESGASLQAAARRLIARVATVEVTSRIREMAARVRPASVRSLDAVHVATAIAAGVETFASFDARQLVAAEDMGIKLDRLA